MRPYPINQKDNVPTEISKIFFIEMFTALDDLVNPASTNVKPACIKNTSIPDNNTHKMLKSVLGSNTSTLGIKAKIVFKFIIIIFRFF